MTLLALMVWTLAALVILGVFLFPRLHGETLQQQDGRNVYIPMYGILNQHSRNSNIVYDVSLRNIAWSVLLFHTVVVPLILLGLFLYKPVGVTNKI